MRYFDHDDFDIDIDQDVDDVGSSYQSGWAAFPSTGTQWDFYNAVPAHPPPAPPPHPFTSLPPELQDQVYETASHDGPPQMRFVTLQETVRHVTGCIRSTCQCETARPNYITFHPLRRSDIAHRPDWTILAHGQNRATRDTVISQVNYQSRADMHRMHANDPFPHEQGDWSLTTITQDRALLGQSCVGEPYHCRAADLLFVRIPPTIHFSPMYAQRVAKHPIAAFDPVCEQVTRIAMSIDNFDELGWDHGVEGIHHRMQAHHVFQLTRDQGFRRIVEGWIPAGWPPEHVRSNPPWIPDEPQRALIPDPLTQGAPITTTWRQQMRILTDLFPALLEFWLVDLNGLPMNCNPSDMRQYRNSNCRSEDLCDECGYVHPGCPQVWGGMEQFEFIEMRPCLMNRNPFWSINHTQTDRLEEYRAWVMRHWPATNVNGNDWQRRVTVKLAGPIWRMEHAPDNL